MYIIWSNFSPFCSNLANTFLSAIWITSSLAKRVQTYLPTFLPSQFGFRGPKCYFRRKCPIPFLLNIKLREIEKTNMPTISGKMGFCIKRVAILFKLYNNNIASKGECCRKVILGAPKTKSLWENPPKIDSQYVCTLLAKELVRDIADRNVYTIYCMQKIGKKIQLLMRT